MLKLLLEQETGEKVTPAAFRRLCVETVCSPRRQYVHSPAAFRRLCVETISWTNFGNGWLPAAFRRLCVETVSNFNNKSPAFQPPLGGCVLKPKNDGGGGGISASRL